MCKENVHMTKRMCNYNLQNVHICAKETKGIDAHFRFCYSELTRNKTTLNTKKEAGFMNNSRAQELMTSMKSFENEAYHKSEMLDEMLRLQSEIVNITFNGDHAATADLKIYDVERHLEQLNEKCGHVADAELQNFKNESRNFCNMIKAEISGRRGELKAFRNLESLTTKNIVLKNVELEDEARRTEIDAIVVTPKCITIVEVKNTNRNIYINPNGQYYRTGEFLRWDSDIAGKMSVKKNLLTVALKDAGIDEVKIREIVVFTDNRIEVQNKCSYLTTCFAEQLACFIEDYTSEEIYTEEEMTHIQEAILKAICKEKYPADFDVEQYKKDFVTLITILEEASIEKENVVETESDEPEIFEEIACEPEKKSEEPKRRKFKEIFTSFVKSDYIKIAGGAVAGVAVAVLTEAVINRR